MKAINIGVAAHIAAASQGGPRYDPSLTPEERSAADNGIWLCQSCGKLIDNDPVRYTAASLMEWKRGAESEAARALENRRSSDSDRDEAFLKIERLMPDLLAEMRKHLSQFSLCREFIASKKGMAFWYPDGQIFTYYYDDHDELDGKLRILQNLGLIRDIQHNRVPRFVMEEELADYLSR